MPFEGDSARDCFGREKAFFDKEMAQRAGVRLREELRAKMLGEEAITLMELKAALWECYPLAYSLMYKRRRAYFFHKGRPELIRGFALELILFCIDKVDTYDPKKGALSTFVGINFPAFLNQCAEQGVYPEAPVSFGIHSTRLTKDMIGHEVAFREALAHFEAQGLADDAVVTVQRKIRTRHNGLQEVPSYPTTVGQIREEFHRKEILLRAGVSLDAAPSAGNTPPKPLYEILPSSPSCMDKPLGREQMAGKNALLEAMESFRQELKPIDRRIFDARFFEDPPVIFRMLGEEFKISKQRVQQIEEKLRQRLKNFLLLLFSPEEIEDGMDSDILIW